MKIVISDNLEKEVVERIEKLGGVTFLPEDLNAALKDAEVLAVRSGTKVTKELLENAPNLKLVARAGVGLDNVDLEACGERGIKVINTPGASTISVAELAIGLMIVLMRNAVLGHEQVRKGVWDRKALVGQELYKKTLGIMGFGRIGSAVAARGRAMGMGVIAFDPFVKEEGDADLVKLEDLLKKADVISLHMPVTPETTEIINKESISKMKDGVFIVNTARGGVINEADLAEALKSGKVAGAALDVTAKEPPEGTILEAPNVILSSHVGASTKQAQLRVGEELVEKLAQFVQQTQKAQG